MSIASSRTKAYRDFAEVDERSFIDRLLSTASSEKTEMEVFHSEAKLPARKPMSNFPRKLHYMLGEVERDGLDDIIAWQPHGRCFVIKKPKELETKLLPLWFEQSKYSSFQRQLNIYGFKRITSTGGALGSDKGAYYHELFLRGKPIIIEGIRRNKTKGTGPRKKSAPDSEPDFYKMSFLPGLKAKTNGVSQVQERRSAPEYAISSRIQTTQYPPFQSGFQVSQGRIAHVAVSEGPARLRMFVSPLDLLRANFDTLQTPFNNLARVRSPFMSYPHAILQPNQFSMISTLVATDLEGKQWLTSAYGNESHADNNRCIRQYASVEASVKGLCHE